VALYLILSVVTFPSILSLHDLFHLEPNRGRKEKKEKKEQKNALHFSILFFKKVTQKKKKKFPRLSPLFCCNKIIIPLTHHTRKPLVH
jgi:hypothetical protein